MDAAGRARLVSLGEEEAEVADGERVDRGERAKRACRRARLGELAERLLGVGRTDEDRRPALARDQPALEKLAEGAVARGHGAGEPEQRALPRIGAKPQVEPAGKRVQLDEHACPALDGQRGKRGGALACSRGALAADDSEHTPRVPLVRVRVRAPCTCFHDRFGRRGGFGLFVRPALERGEECLLESVASTTSSTPRASSSCRSWASLARPAIRAPPARTRAQWAAVRPERSGERRTAAVSASSTSCSSSSASEALARGSSTAPRPKRRCSIARSATGVSASTTGRRSTPISPAALAGGIGAVRARPPSRSRSIFPSVFASASPAASEGRRGRR